MKPEMEPVGNGKCPVWKASLVICAGDLKDIFFSKSYVCTSMTVPPYSAPVAGARTGVVQGRDRAGRCDGFGEEEGKEEKTGPHVSAISCQEG
jgi:hypothetical protein